MFLRRPVIACAKGVDVLQAARGTQAGGKEGLMEGLSAPLLL